MKRLSILFIILSAAACRGGNSGDDAGDDGVTPDGTINVDDASIYDIQSPDNVVPIGTQVNIRGVVVTAIDNYGAKKGNFWVQEPGGGEYSGVLVFGAPLDQVAALQVGDLVDVETAVKDEFALSDDTSGRTTTEMTPPSGGAITVSKVGDGTPATPSVVDPVAIAQMDASSQDAEWEKWEGVLIEVDNVSVNGSIRTIGTTDPTFTKFPITGPLQVESSLAAFPDAATIPAGTCLASVTGIGDYFYDWLLEPRETGEIATGGTTCPAQEADATACADGLDNDADGFADCADFSCQSLDSCSTDTTVIAIQNGDPAAGTVVSLSGVYITAIDDVGTSKGIYVADDPVAAAYDGVYVFTGSSLPASAAIGATADVQGTIQEYDNVTPPDSDTLTEINATSGTVTVTPGVAVLTPLTGISLNTLKEIGGANGGEPYEGVLVELTNVHVTNDAIGNDRLEVTDQNGDTIIVDDDAYNYAAATYPANTTCFATLTGVMTVNVFDAERRLLPRQVTDMVTVGGSCN